MRLPSAITETERENGSNAYLMTLVAVIAGFPLPIINLLACVIFAFSLKNKSDFVRFHICQVITSQLALVLMNSVLFTWTIRIIFTDLEISAGYVSYFAAALVLNITDFIANIRGAIAARKGQHFSMAFFGWLAWVIVYSRDKDSLQHVPKSYGAPKAIMQLILLIALFIAVFFTVKIISPRYLPQSRWLSIENEVSLGKELTSLLLRSEEKIDNRICKNFTDTIKNRLTKANAPSHYEYNIYIIRKEEINAITLPGGNIIVYSGLVETAESSEEVAAVIAHETGHVEKRHILSRLLREMGITALLAAVGGSGSINVLQEILHHVVGNSFNRDQEREADKFALHSLEKSGIDPSALATFFFRIQDNNETLPEEYEWTEFISTHPGYGSRIDMANNYKTSEGFQEIPLPLIADVQKAIRR